MIKLISLSFIALWIVSAVYFKKTDEEQNEKPIEVKNIF